VNSFEALRDAFSERVQRDEPLAPHTTFRIGGPTDLFLRGEKIDELSQAIRSARQMQIPVLLLGNGSNILVRDNGWRGLVIENHCAAYSIEVKNESRAILRAESGAALPLLANQMARAGWSGLEWGIGIPGTIGGAMVGNAGAHGGCIADVLQSVTILDAQSQIIELPKYELAFGYRASRFKGTRDEIILRAEFELYRDEPAACIARMNAYTEHRRRTQPTEFSVGSMFKNPPGDPSADGFASLTTGFTLSSGEVLRASFAGQLIEQAGLKGTRIGNVEVSRVHANFFVNHGGARAADVLELVKVARQRVQEKFGVELELEIEVVGE